MNAALGVSTNIPEMSAEHVAVPFVVLVNGYIEQMLSLAATVRHDEPGTAELIEAFTETLAGSALDLVRGWPA